MMGVLDTAATCIRCGGPTNAQCLQCHENCCWLCLDTHARDKHADAPEPRRAMTSPATMPGMYRNAREALGLPPLDDVRHAVDQASERAAARQALRARQAPLPPQYHGTGEFTKPPADSISAVHVYGAGGPDGKRIEETIELDPPINVDALADLRVSVSDEPTTERGGAGGSSVGSEPIEEHVHRYSIFYDHGVQVGECACGATRRYETPEAPRKAPGR